MRADEQQFHEFVAARSRALGRTAYLLTGDHHLAEDLLQTALLQVARHWERIDGHPEAYARRVLYTQNVSWWRRKRFAERSLESYDDRPVAAADPTPDPLAHMLPVSRYLWCQLSASESRCGVCRAVGRAAIARSM
ncbi:sigma factor [Nocardioides campestrisoli]|uniref:sigma factor n=1 Tax=Nocardioides campestrisoli TaxID=2736757 RepID=UPI001CD55556|nr:sigma factor [Nocardioides campestrisoli]